MQNLSKWRWAFMTMALLAGIAYFGPFYGVSFTEKYMIEIPAFAIVCLALGLWGARAVRAKGTGLGFPWVLGATALLGWLIALAGAVLAGPGPGALVPLMLMVLPGSIAGTLLNAAALVGLLLQARKAPNAT